MRWRGVHILKKLRFLNSLNESSKVVVVNRCLHFAITMQSNSNLIVMVLTRVAYNLVAILRKMMNEHDEDTIFGTDDCFTFGGNGGV